MASATLELASAAIALALLNPSLRYWQAAWPVMAGLCGLLLIPAIPLVAGGLREQPDLIAPDLFAFGMTRLAAEAAFLLAGSWAGYRRGGLRLIVGGLVVAGTIDIAVGLVLRQFSPLHVWGIAKGINAYRYTGTLLNANASGCIFGVTAVLATGLLQDAMLHPVKRGMRAFAPFYYFALIMIAVGACAITGSRTALILTLIGLAVMVRARHQRKRLWASPTAMALGVCSFLLLGGILFTAGGTTFDRAKLLGQDTTERWAIWSAFFDAARHAPLLGYGPASFDAIKAVTMQNPEQARLLWYVNSPHNVVLGVVLEHGLLFLSIVALVGLLMTRPFVWIWRGRIQHPSGLAALASCFMIVGCASVDIALDVPAIMALFMVLLGALWGRGLRNRHEDGLLTVSADGRRH